MWQIQRNRLPPNLWTFISEFGKHSIECVRGSSVLELYIFSEFYFWKVKENLISQDRRCYNTFQIHLPKNLRFLDFLPGAYIENIWMESTISSLRFTGGENKLLMRHCRFIRKCKRCLCVEAEGFLWPNETFQFMLSAYSQSICINFLMQHRKIRNIC